ncbi:MAG: ATP-binding cassette domain-containing protein [bacterium]|nr:ATP-binding cassette domain-containing protein [bacterium]
MALARSTGPLEAGLSAIVARDLTKRYGRTVAVDGVSFEVQGGEIVGFLGPNGAGKTTTLRMLAGLIRPSDGEGRILDERVPGPALRRVGTMIEEPSFYPYMTGRDNLRYAATLHGGVAASRIDEVLGFVKLDRAAEKRVKAYSQGMRQRLGLARSLLWAPEVLLLDEPTNGLDPVGIAEIRENLRAVAASGVTVLISSHILAEIEKLVDRILAIDKGKLVYDGPLDALVRRLDTDAITYHLQASDGAGLLAALRDLGLTAVPEGDHGAHVTLPAADADGLVGRLVNAGVNVLEARRQVDDLEGAYLRLVRGDGRPS